MWLLNYLWTIRERFNLIPYKSIKNSIGVIYHHYRNGTVDVSICDGTKCSKCKCNM